MGSLAGRRRLSEERTLGLVWKVREETPSARPGQNTAGKALAETARGI